VEINSLSVAEGACNTAVLIENSVHATGSVVLGNGALVALNNGGSVASSSFTIQAGGELQGAGVWFASHLSVADCLQVPSSRQRFPFRGRLLQAPMTTLQHVCLTTAPPKATCFRLRTLLQLFLAAQVHTLILNTMMTPSSSLVSLRLDC
jgi:hypothetical protein